MNALNVRISPMAWVIRTKVPPLSLGGAVQEQLRQATGLPVSDIRSMAQIVSRSTSRERFNTLLMTVFALSALALAAIGIYGVMAYAVQQRTREIGVRLALGADPGAVRRMVVMQGMRLAISGVVIGVVARVRPVALHEYPVIWRGGARSAGIRRRARALGCYRVDRGLGSRGSGEPDRSAERAALVLMRRIVGWAVLLCAVAVPAVAVGRIRRELSRRCPPSWQASYAIRWAIP